MKKSLAIVAACCAFALALGLVGCGGSSSGSAAASGSAASGSAAASAGSASASDAMSAYKADGYLDEFGIVTAKALIELDGAELTQVAEAAKYEWTDEHAEWTKIGSELAPSKGLSAEDREAAGSNITDTSKYEFTPDEVAGFAVGGKGTPVKWLMTSKAQYADAAEVLADQQVTVVDQCEVEHRYYGTEIWSIVQNSAGDKFLLCTWRYDSDSSGAYDLYNEDYIAHNSRGIASHFNMGDYLLADVHTIDEIWPILQSGEVS
ncbi:MAG: hypothetical protein IJ111_10050 [Eggerthellaceae bacterium]|nr:hypothetical protein [Eggerthellaceae bacterium]